VSVLPDIRRPATRRVNARCPTTRCRHQAPVIHSNGLPVPTIHRRTHPGCARAAARSGFRHGPPSPQPMPGPTRPPARRNSPLASRQSRAGHPGIDAQLRQGRSQPFYRGVYATFTGKPTRISVLWAAVLRGGPGAILSHYSAAELDGLADRPGPACHVMISSARRLTAFQDQGRGSGGAAPSQTSGMGVEGSARRATSTWRFERMRAWMSSVTSQTLTFIPATTAPPDSQNAMNSRASRSPR
jgi:hypothetical protein